MAAVATDARLGPQAAASVAESPTAGLARVQSLGGRQAGGTDVCGRPAPEAALARRGSGHRAGSVSVPRGRGQSKPPQGPSAPSPVWAHVAPGGTRLRRGTTAHQSEPPCVG
jgi:hypothetical protein